jgi:hypothetical protein
MMAKVIFKVLILARGKVELSTTDRLRPPLALLKEEFCCCTSLPTLDTTITMLEQCTKNITKHILWRNCGVEECEKKVIRGGGLGRVVREVRQHSKDHEFESQRWQ